MAPSKTHCSNCYTKGHRVWKCSKPRAVTKCPERHEDYIKWYAMKMEDKGQVNLVDGGLGSLCVTLTPSWFKSLIMPLR